MNEMEFHHRAPDTAERCRGRGCGVAGAVRGGARAPVDGSGEGATTSTGTGAGSEQGDARHPLTSLRAVV